MGYETRFNTQKILSVLAALTISGLLTVATLAVTGNQTVGGHLTVSGSSTSETALVANATNTNALAIRDGNGTNIFTVNTSTDLATVNGDLAVNESVYFDAEIDDGNSGVADTINWSLGNKHKSTVTGAVVYTFTAPAGPTGLTLKVVNGGSSNPSWPAAVKWPAATEPTWTAAGTDIVSCYFDGTNYYCAAVLDVR